MTSAIASKTNNDDKLRPAPAIKRGVYPGAKGVSAPDNSTGAKIERVALLLFSAKGVDAVGIREIADEVGLTVGSLYRHFTSKEELVTDLFAAMHGRLCEVITETGEITDKFDERLSKVITAYCHLADKDWELFQFHLLHQHRVLPTLKSSAGDPVGLMVDMVAQAMKKGEIPRRDPEIATSMALGVVMQVALHKSYLRTNQKLSRLAPEMIRAALATFS